MKLEDVWKKSGENPGPKVRYEGWGHSHKYFLIDSVDAINGFFLGKLDTGEIMKYPMNSLFWKLYEEGAEQDPKAS